MLLPPQKRYRNIDISFKHQCRLQILWISVEFCCDNGGKFDLFWHHINWICSHFSFLPPISLLRKRWEHSTKSVMMSGILLQVYFKFRHQLLIAESNKKWKWKCVWGGKPNQIGHFKTNWRKNINLLSFSDDIGGNLIYVGGGGDILASLTHAPKQSKMNSTWPIIMLIFPSHNNVNTKWTFAQDQRLVFIVNEGDHLLPTLKCVSFKGERSGNGSRDGGGGDFLF